MSTRTPVKSAWCAVCCTRHTTREPCPGELLATGPESHGWRVLVSTRTVQEVYGVVVAPCGDRWRARILTYPNILWVSSGGGSIKFVGKTAADAEAQGIAFVQAHCEARGYRIKQKLPAVRCGSIDPEQAPGSAASAEVRAIERRLRPHVVRYGIGRTKEEAETDNVSEGGMFIRTDRPAAVGTSFQIELQIGGAWLPLQGVVRWIREAGEIGRPAGMGIQVLQPPPRFIHLVRQHRTAETAVAPVTKTVETGEGEDGS
jgi:hypothetical protein